MEELISARDRARIYLGIVLIALQCVAITFISITTSVNIPYEDDYLGILSFLHRYAALQGWSARAFWVLTSQHTQYKLILLHGIIAVQYACYGHVNLRALDLLGDASLLVSAGLLWLYVCRSVSGSPARVWTYVPVCLLFLSPIYWRNMNWALCAVQNLSIIMFALAAFLCLAYRGRLPAALMLTAIVFSVATSGNGFFVALVVLAMLLLERRLQLAASVAVLMAVLGAVYAIGYHSYSIGPPLSLHQTEEAFVLIPFTFLGGAAIQAYWAILLGIVTLTLFIWLVKQGWPKADPAAFAAALFCVTTALGVAISRHRFSWVAGLADRYRMYSLLLIVLELIGLLRIVDFNREQPSEQKSAFLRVVQSLRYSRSAVAAIAVAAVLYAVQADRTGYRLLSARQAFLTIHLIEWERSPSSIILMPDEEHHMKLPEWVQARSNFQAECAQDVALGLYIPPKTPDDALPARPPVVP